MTAAAHIIHRHILEAEFAGGESGGVLLHKQLQAVCADRLVPALSSIFDSLSPTALHLTIDRMEVDAGHLTLATFEHDFVHVVAAAVEQQLRNHLAEMPQRSQVREHARADSDIDAVAAVQFRSEAKALADVFVVFLRTGVLPWWYRLPHDQGLARALASQWATTQGQRLIMQALAGAPLDAKMAARLLRQFPFALVVEIATSLSPATALAATQALAMIAAHSADLAAAIQHAIWQAALLSTHNSPPPTSAQLAALARSLLSHRKSEVGTVARQAIETAYPEPNMVQLRPTQERVFRETELSEENSITVECAGVVLLHPFLPQLFAALGYSSGKTLIQPDRAMGLLHYLATGENQAPEYKLPLAKLLCDQNMDEPAAAPVILTQEEMAEADALLHAVIDHWQALGDTSADGLRGAFLVRAGKLQTRNGETVLQVEQQSFDILLEKLPWGVSAVQLPWMKHILWVEWRQ